MLYTVIFPEDDREEMEGLSLRKAIHIALNALSKGLLGVILYNEDYGIETTLTRLGGHKFVHIQHRVHRIGTSPLGYYYEKNEEDEETYFDEHNFEYNVALGHNQIQKLDRVNTRQIILMGKIAESFGWRTLVNSKPY